METLVITLIVNALATGASAIAGSQAIVNDSVREAYQSLKTLIEHKFEGVPEALLVLSKYEEKPTIWTAPLKEELKQIRAYQDEEIVKTAQKLILLVKQPQPIEYGYITAIYRQYQHLERSYKESLYRTKRHVYICLVCVILGFLVMLFGAFLISTRYSFVGFVSLVGALITAIVAFFFFQQAREADKNADIHFRKLLQADRKSWASRLRLMTDQKPPHFFKEEILQQLLNAS